MVEEARKEEKNYIRESGNKVISKNIFHEEGVYVMQRNERIKKKLRIIYEIYD